MEDWKPTVKSRLGFKTAKRRSPYVTEPHIKNGTRSVKERLGPRVENRIEWTDTTRTVCSSIRPVKERLGRRYKTSDRITPMASRFNESVHVWNRNENKVTGLRVHINQDIKLNYEECNNITGILLHTAAMHNNCYRSLKNDYTRMFNKDANSKKERRQKYLNKKCMEILRKEKSDIREKDLHLIDEREKRHFVKNVLLMLGKENEYRSFRKKVKRRKRRPDKRYDKMRKRKQNIPDNFGRLCTTKFGDTQGSNTKVGNDDEEEEVIVLDEEIYLDGDQEPEQVQRSNDGVKKVPIPIKGREIINYGEIFIDTSPLTVNLSHREQSADKEISSIMLSSPVQQPSVKFEKRSWMTETEDTSEKSYTKIMAQTNQHKLGMLPGNWQSPIPVVLAHSDPLKSLQRCMFTEKASNKISAVSLTSCSSVKIEGTSKTNPLQDTVTSSTLRSDTQTDVSNIVVGAKGVLEEMKSGSWERKLKYAISGEMASPATETYDSNNVHLSAQTANTGTIPEVDAIMEKAGEYMLTKPMERLQGIDEKKPLVKESMKSKYSDTQKDSALQTNIRTLLDSLSEFDDNFLNFECDAEIDTELDKRKHDELMKEMEELVA